MIKIKIEILTIMHAWCECTHDHDMNENNENNEEGRYYESLGHCEVASETPQDGS